MNLPAFDIPIPPLPIEIPVLLHPPLVHFAIVLPIIILLIEIVNIFMKRKALTVTTFLFFILLIIIYAGAYLTGKVDGKEAWDLLGEAGQADLKEHKLIGTYLLVASLVLMFVKLFAVALRTWWMKLLYLLILAGFVAAVLYQGKEGGELVFEHGANVEKVQTLDEEVFDLKEELEELEEETKENAAEATETTTKASESAVEETKENAAEATESTTKASESAVEETKENAAEATESTTKAAKSAVEETKENAAEATETTTEAAESAVEEAVETNTTK